MIDFRASSKASLKAVTKWQAIFAAGMALSGCEQVQPSDIPVMSEPYQYSATIDEFTGRSVLKAELMDLKEGHVTKTTFGCDASSNAPENRHESALFAFGLQTGQGAPIVPQRIRFKLDNEPPVDALWTLDADHTSDNFIVP